MHCNAALDLEDTPYWELALLLTSVLGNFQHLPCAMHPDTDARRVAKEGVGQKGIVGDHLEVPMRITLAHMSIRASTTIASERPLFS